MTSGSGSFNVDNFLSLILKSGLLDLEELRAACNDFRAESSALGLEPTFDSLCDFFITKNLLTAWQCEMLKEGKYKGFFLGKFKLLESLGPDETCSNYLAEEVSTKHRVRLRIVPKRIAPKDGKIHYQVKEL